jgi:hypothetical protein
MSQPRQHPETDGRKDPQLTFLRATKQLRRRSRALYTTPYVPSPSFAIFS